MLDRLVAYLGALFFFGDKILFISGRHQPSKQIDNTYSKEYVEFINLLVKLHIEDEVIGRVVCLGILFVSKVCFLLFLIFYY